MEKQNEHFHFDNKQLSGKVALRDDQIAEMQRHIGLLERKLQEYHTISVILTA
jgi:hypothetical protein